jgi:translation initiation factor IF-2
MREALGRLNAELYPPFKEIGFEVRSQGNMPLPPLIDSPRRAGEKATLATPKKDEPGPARKDAPAKPAAKPSSGGGGGGGGGAGGNAMTPDSDEAAAQLAEAEKAAAEKKKPAAKPGAKPGAKPAAGKKK